MTPTPHKILVAGSTGYLGSHLVKALCITGSPFKALARQKDKLIAMGLSEDQIKVAHVTDASSLRGCCNDIDVVISCVGITRQKEGLTYMDVDYQANLNLLLEAERAGVKKFIYISAFDAKNHQNVRLLKAKERFAEKLLVSKVLTPCIIRPNGFFADIEAFYSMAKSGRVYLFGTGDVQLNPIHGKDLAKFCIESIESDKYELDIGGPEVLSSIDIANLAFSSQEKTPKITHLPDWFRRASLFVSSLLPEKMTGPAEFFLTVMEQDMIAPTYGRHTLAEHFKEIHNADIQS